MSSTSDVAPSTLTVRLLDHGVEVDYLDGRTTLYRGVPEKVAGRLRTKPGREVHVLVTDPTGTEGVLLYVEDRTTGDAMLEDTGVGRVLLDRGESSEVFPGVRARRVGDHRVEVEADPAAVTGRVFVFAEDEWGEDAYEFVAESDLDEETDAGD
ncbi:MAG: DUF5796 family protein [Haloferacaceae archaeon]